MEKLMPSGKPASANDVVRALNSPELCDERPVIRATKYALSLPGCDIIAVEVDGAMPIIAPVFNSVRSVATFVRDLRDLQPWAVITYEFNDGRRVKVK